MGEPIRSANDLNCWLLLIVCIGFGGAGKGDVTVSRLSGLRSGTAVAEDMDLGVYLWLGVGVTEVEEVSFAGAAWVGLTTELHLGLDGTGLGLGRFGPDDTGGAYTPWR